MSSIYGRCTIETIDNIKEKLSNESKLELWYFNQTVRFNNIVTNKPKKIVITKVYKIEYLNNRLKFKDEYDNLIVLIWNKLYMYDNYDIMVREYNKMLLLNINILLDELNYQLSLKKKYIPNKEVNDLKSAIKEMKLKFINTDYIMETITGEF